MHRLRRWPIFVVVLVVLAIGATAAAIRADDGDERPKVRRWDPRVADLAEFVEQARGLDFRHPVRTDFLSDAAFRKEVTNGPELTAEDADELQHFEGLFRALGLVEGDLDLVEATDTLKGEGIIGLFDPEEDRILIRGDRISTGMRPTIVHELTHALQAQYHDLEQEFDLSGEQIGFSSLIEADAMRIEDEYVASLSEDEQRAVNETQTEQADGVDLEGVPAILSELFSLPYALGPPFLDALVDDGGDEAVDRAFAKPPSTEEHIIDPDAYLAGDLPRAVQAPKLRAGERAVDEAGDFGMISLLLVLGERLPFAQAWQAVSGWDGDASIGYRTKGRDCIRVRVALDTEVDADELLVATRTWAEGRSSATVSRRGRIVELTSCDPGAAAAPTNTPGRPRTFELLQLRVELVSSLEASGANHRQATCVADAVFAEHDPAALLEVAQITDGNDPRLVRLQRDVSASAERCR